MSKKKSIQICPLKGNWTFVVQWVIWGKVQYRIWNPHRISKSKKNKIIEIGYALIKRAKIVMFWILIEFSSLRKKIFKSVHKQEIGLLWSSKSYEIMLELKIACLEWTYGCPVIDYRVASLFTRYLTAIGISPESLKSIGQF